MDDKINIEKQSLHCAVQHIKFFYYQAVKNELADFGFPCADCEYGLSHSCDFDWLEKLIPIIKKTNIKFTVGFVESSNTQDSDRIRPYKNRRLGNHTDN